MSMRFKKCILLSLNLFIILLLKGTENDTAGMVRMGQLDSIFPPPKSVVAIAFTGGFLGKGKPLDEMEEYAGTTGKIVNCCRRFAYKRNKPFYGLVIGSGVSSRKSVRNALKFIHQTNSKIETIIVYGYSWGGDFAIELSKRLAKKRQKVDLLFTLDATDGPLQNFTVDKKIPENVKLNYNFYQTENLGTSSGSDFIFRKGSGSDASSFDSPNSHGRANLVINSEKTSVINQNLTGIGGIFHSNLDEKVFSIVLRHIANQHVFRPQEN